MHRRQIEVSVGIDKSNLPLSRLFCLIQVDLQDLEAVVDCEIEWFSTGNLEEFDQFAVGSIYHSNDVIGHGHPLSVEKFD